ncbi:hypothetical protein R3P38DRAFT_2896646 [Favolaschia claudopus]|uniref:Uncharacterized protein n=1 Tax=Favolaschia claudopus TaxID=2862362 RepID=A0AAW0CNW1_9AGAR
MLFRSASLLSLALLSLAAPAAPETEADLAPDVNSLGYLRCSAGSENQVIGYISRSLNSFGEYIGVSPSSDPNDVNHRMLVSLDVTGTGPQALLVKNAPKNNFPFLGGIAGSQGSSIGSDGDYVLIGGTQSTAVGAKPSYCGNTFTDSTNKLRKCASAIWVFNSTSNQVTPQWTNDDGTAVTGNVGYVNEAFVITGDKKEFEDTWEDKVEWVTLTLEN